MQRALQSQLSQATNQGLLNIRQAEVDYYMNLHMSFGTQAALIGVFVYGVFTQNNVNHSNIYSSVAIAIYDVSVAVTLGLALHILLITMMLQVMGPGLALNGKLGSMAIATDGMKSELKHVVSAFALMIFMWSVTTMAAFWMVMNIAPAIISTAGFLIISRFWIVACERIYLRLYYEDDATARWEARRDSISSNLEDGIGMAFVSENPADVHPVNVPTGNGDYSNSNNVSSMGTTDGTPHPAGKKSLFAYVFPFTRAAAETKRAQKNQPLLSAFGISGGRSGVSSTTRGAHKNDGDSGHDSPNSVEMSPCSSVDDNRTATQPSQTSIGTNVRGVSSKAGIAMEGYATVRMSKRRKRDTLKEPWDRRYLTLNVSGQIYIYKSRQEYRQNANAPIFTRPLTLSDFMVKVDNLDNESRAGAAMDAALTEENRTVFSDDTYASNAAQKAENEKIKPFRFQLTLLPCTDNTGNDLLDSQSRTGWILRFDTEEELLLWSSSMESVSPASFQ